MVGRTYLERGRPVLVLARWAGARPHNVLIRRDDGTLVIRPARGLRRVRQRLYARATRPEEEPMPMILISPEFTQEQYEETARRLTGGKKSKMESPDDWPVAGLLSHAAGQGASVFRVVDVWESEEALNSFAEIIVPIMREVGVEGDPEVYPAHTYVSS